VSAISAQSSSIILMTFIDQNNTDICAPNKTVGLIVSSAS